MGKALLIKSSAGEKEAAQGVWHSFDQATPYIQGIQTGDLVENIDVEVLNSMISGLPNVWSRSRIFGYSFKYTRKDVNVSTSGLIKFYELLVKEWKGLIALMALQPDKINVSPKIEFDVNNLSPLFSIPNSLGRMLFEDIDLWCDPLAMRDQKIEKPFVQLIFYKDILIGATSPYSLVFSAIDYGTFPVSPDVPWFRNGKLDDPLEFGNLSNDKIQKLYLLVSNLVKRLPDFEKLLQINRNGKEPMILSPLYEFLQTWRDQIKAKGQHLVDEGALDAELNLAEPFAPLFRVKQQVYFKNGTFSFNDTSGEHIDLQKILLQDDFIFNINQTNERLPLSESAVYLLRALDPENQGKIWYFPLPFSSYGLKLFKNQISDLVASTSTERHELRASFKPREFRLVVELFLVIDGKKQTPIVHEYEIKMITGVQRNIIMWPNFISKNWTSYYVYSEYPSNNRDIKFVPFYKDYTEMGGYDAGSFIMNDKAEIVFPESDTYGTDIELSRIVRYPIEIATSEDHPYEIIRSNKPLAGLEIRSLINGKDRICGYLIVKKANEDSMLDKKIIDMSYETNFDDVVVGFDFGSNNSCISYSRINDNDVKPIPFNNRRVFLLGSESMDPNQEQTAKRNELLFFQNEIPFNGQIKSWVHDHNHRYIASGMEQEEISGGVPIFESNLVIHNMDERTITTNAGTLHHSMKWLNDMKGNEKKQAFLKGVWYMVVADLYAMRLRPKEIRWSYPGSFAPFDIRQYQLMYNQLSKVPIRNYAVEVSQTPATEAEAVCNYALTKAGLTGRNLMLGIDVGGSTANVLIVAMDRAARAFKMNKQSSLRISAGVLSSIIRRSPEFRQAIIKYHDSPNCKIKVANIHSMVENPQTAPFYLNSILDRLRDESFADFYTAIARSAPAIFAVPAYITGLLLYYSGQLIAKSITENNYTGISLIDFLPFGKGGRIFDWLDIYPGAQMASEYYNLCFKSGYGVGSENLKIEKKNSIRIDNKSEVSKGLSAPQKVMVDTFVRENSDLFGEEGFVYFPQGGEAQKLGKDQTINYQHLEEMDFGIEIPEKFVEFEKFLNIFFDFAGSRKTGMIRNIAVLEQKKPNLSRELKNYITNDPEWKKADEQKRQGLPFEFKHSMFVLTGMCFMDRFLIPEIYK